MQLQVYQPWIPSVLEVLDLGFNQALSPARKRIKRRILPRCHHPPRPETLRWLRGSLLTSGTEETASWVGFRGTWLDYI